jgi:YidC/Oxa1 family membrane protein insertase
MIPINFKQTKNLKKSAIIQEKTKELQKLYADNQEQMNKEIMNLYKENNMSPFSGCLTSIVTLFLFISVFYIVSRPLTYMRHLDQNIVTQYTEEIYNTNSNGENIVSNEVASIENTTSNNSNNRRTYPEIAIIREKGDEDERVHLNMNFLGLDLSDIPSQNYSNWTVFIIPVLYVLTTFVSLKLNEKMTKKRKEDAVANKVVTERIVSRNENKEEKMLVPTEKTEDDEMIDTMSDMTKTMTWMMPIMSVSISLIAPLGLALYWLVGNIFMIVERVVTNKIIEKDDK